MRIFRLSCLLACLVAYLPCHLANAEELAVVNEVVIASNPVHENVAEKYLREATGEKSSVTTDSSHSAFKIYVPVKNHVKKGSTVDLETADDACQQLKQYLRKLRQDNSKRRTAKQTTKLIHNFECSPNVILHASLTPNDPKFRDLWGLNYGLDTDMDLPEAWNKTTGSNEIVVAVIDTGIDYNHQDLAQNMWKNPKEAAGLPDVDDDGNGVVDDIYGYNAITGSGNPMDDNNHGTHCAGTIGAVGNNSIGVVGVNHKIKMMAVKFLSSSGSGNLMHAIKSIDYVTDQKIAGVNVVASNNSWGGGPFISALRDAISRASSHNILFVAAAGNDALNIDDYPSYPASYDVENIISVGSVSPNGEMSYFSNYGVNNVDVVAPGSGILSTTIGNTYQFFSGTSMATPHITGVIALLKSYAANASMSTVKDILFKSGKPLSGAVGRTKYGIQPSANEMLLEADRRGLGGVIPATPTPSPSPTPTSTPTRTPTPTATPTTAPGYWNIKGSVSAGNSKLPLAKVILKVNGQTLITYTDAQGAYSFNNVYGPAEYTVEVISAGQQFSSQSGTLTGHVNFNFSGATKNYLLSAKVIDKNGQGVAGVVVGEAGSGAKLTGSDGIASFNLPYGREYNLTVDTSAHDFLESELNGTIKGDVTRVFVVLPD